MNKVVKLKELLEIKNGSDYKSYNWGSIPVYGSGGLMTFIDTYVYDGESILLPRKGTLNNIMYVDEKFWTVDTMYWSIIDKAKVYPKYLFCYLSLLDLSSRDSGSTLPSMTFGSYYDLPINLIDYNMQKKIGDFYFLLTEKIELNNKIISELESMAKTLYDYWFLQFDFPDENGKPYKSSGGKMVWNEELKKEIPEGWEAIELGKLFHIIMGSSPKGDTLNESKDGIEFYQGSTDFGKIFPTERVYTTGAIRYAKANDVLLSVRAPVGDMNIAMNDCCIGRGLSAIRHESSMFALNTLRTLESYFNIYNGSGTTFGALTSDALNEQLVVNPPDELILDYSKIVLPFEKMLRKCENENRKLASLRDFLLPMLMNGQVTFKDSK